MALTTKAYMPEMVGRFTVEPANPVSTPGVCATCGSPKCEEGFVNPNLDFEWYGTVIFCRGCVIEMAAMYGLITPEMAEDYQIQLNELVKENELLKDQNKKYEGMIDGFSGQWTKSRTSAMLSDVIAKSAPEPEPIVEQFVPKFTIPGEQRETFESGSGKGLPNI